MLKVDSSPRPRVPSGFKSDRKWEPGPLPPVINLWQKICWTESGPIDQNLSEELRLDTDLCFLSPSNMPFHLLSTDNLTCLFPKDLGNKTSWVLKSNWKVLRYKFAIIEWLGETLLREMSVCTSITTPQSALSGFSGVSKEIWNCNIHFLWLPQSELLPIYLDGIKNLMSVVALLP